MEGHRLSHRRPRSSLPYGLVFAAHRREDRRERLFHTTKPSDGVSSNPADAGFFAVLDLPTACRFALPIAKLTAGVGKPVVTLSPASVEAGYKAMTTTPRRIPCAAAGPAIRRHGRSQRWTTRSCLPLRRAPIPRAPRASPASCGTRRDPASSVCPMASSRCRAALRPRPHRSRPCSRRRPPRRPRRRHRPRRSQSSIPGVLRLCPRNRRPRQLRPAPLHPPAPRPRPLR